MIGHSFLKSLATKSARHPLLFIFAAMLLAAACIFYTSRKLEFETSRNDLVSRHQRYVQLAKEYEAQFKGLDDFIVVVRGPDLAVAKIFSDRLAAELKKSKKHIAEVFHRIGDDVFEGKKLLFLEPDKLEDLSRNLEDHYDLIEGLLESPSLYQILSFVNRKMKEALVATAAGNLLGNGDDSDEAEEDDSHRITFLSALLRQANQALDGARYDSPWSDFFGSGKLDEDGYITSDDKKYVLMQVRHIEGDGFLKHAGAAIFIRSTITRLQSEFPGVEVGVTGSPALSADEMVASMNDMKVAGVLALTGVTLLFLIAFREIRRPLLVIVSLLVGISWALGFLTLTVGHLSILTVAFTSILIGLGIDFGFHLLARYEEERFKGFEAPQALEISMEQTLPSLIATAMTTATAFFAIMLADFRGIQELGWISGGGILLTFLAYIICFPAFMILTEGDQRQVKWQPRFGSHALTSLINNKPGLILAIAIVVTLLTLPAFRAVTFDYNLLNLQSEKTESVRWERRIIESTESSWYALAAYDSMAEMRKKQIAFEDLPSVSKTRSILDLLPEKQAERIKKIKEIGETIEEFNYSGVPEPPSPKLNKLKDILQKCKFTLRKKDGKDKNLAAEIEKARAELLKFIANLDQQDETKAKEALTGFQARLFSDLGSKFDLLTKNLAKSPITLDDVPLSIRDRFVSRRPLYLMHIFSSRNIWEKEAMDEFVLQLRTVDPEVTGAPVVGRESIRLMKNGYIEGGIYAFLAIVALVFLLFRDLKFTVFALVPVIVGTVWTIGLMWVFSLKFNLANLVVVPLIIGIAIDGGIHMLHRVREEGGAGEILLRSTPRAITLSFLSTMVGFGSLLIADHNGIFSLGLLLTLAVGSALVVTLTVLPALLLKFESGNK